jgi:drug/metabolite transporter (DMT)-like permease
MAITTSLRSITSGAIGMALVGGSVGVSHTLVEAPLFTTQAIRYLAAALIMLLLARRAGAPLTRPRGPEWLWLGGIAATGLVLFNVAIVRGVAHAEPAVIAVAVSCVPIALGVIGPLLQHRSPQPHVVLAAVVVTAGAVLVEGTGRTDAIGIGWAAVALLCEAAFTLLAVPVLPRHGAWGVSVHSVWLGGAMYTVLAVAGEGTHAVTELTRTDLAAVAYLTVFVTAAAFLLWYSAVATLGPDRVGLLTGVAPISAAAAGLLLGGTVPGTLVWVGIAVVVAGLACGLRARRPDRVVVPRDREPNRHAIAGS